MSAYSGSRRGSQSTGSSSSASTHDGPAPGKQSLASQVQAAPAQGAASAPATYTVRPGDTLGAIARRVLGDPSRWQEIANANNITDPRTLQIGTVLTLPASASPSTTPEGPDEADGGGGGGGGGGGAGGGASAEVPPEPAAQVIHTVARGDTLSAIAQRYLGDSNKWRVIAEANGITDPRTLKVGQPLVIPGASPSAPQQDPTDATGNGTGTGSGESPTDNGTGTGNGTGGTGTGTNDTQGQTPSPDTTTGNGTANGTGNSTTGNGNTTNDTGGQTPSPDTTTGNGEGEQPQPPAAAGEHIVTDPRAFVRSDPPALASTGTSIPAGTKVRIVETTVKEGRSYVKVEQVLQEGDPGPAQVFGWTSKANLAGFEGGGHDKENDASLRPEDAILLGGLSGLERAMAVIYNAKAKYLHEQAQALGISTAAAAAVLKVESGGGGFASDGRMIIRFENHVFYDRWGKNNKATFDKHFQYSSDKRWQGHKFRANETDAWAAAHQSQSQEWQILEFARGLSNDPALESISMGAAQIMGFNYATEGYTSVQQMFDQMSGAIKPQLVGMFTFIQNTSLCINGLKEGNYVKFAKGYNGAGQAETYGALIKAAADAWTKVTEGKTYSG